MIPDTENDFNDSYGELKVFTALRDSLPDDYTVFHSFRWSRRTQKGRIEWGEADFTVFHPEYGILVIEVKSGGIALDSGLWWYERTDNQKRYPMKDPLEQANRTKFKVIEMIEDVLPENEYCWAESVVWFPSISDREIIKDMPNTYCKENVFMDWALNNTKHAIESAYQFYDSERRTNLSTESAKLIVRTIAPAFYAVPSLSTLYAEQEHHFLRLTNEQNGLLDYLDEQQTAVIQGSAGTGKTLLAVEKARRLSGSDKVLFLCFNRFLMEDLRRKVQGENIAFYNLQSLVVREAGASRSPTDEVITDYLNRYDETTTWDYKHIIVDEGQDFNDAHLNLLAIIAGIHNGVFYIFYDKNQLVQRRELPEWIKNAECRLVLRRNCRNTRSIATTSGRPIYVEPVLWEKSVPGKSPDFHILSDVKTLSGKLVELVSKYLNAGIPINQITLLTVRTEEQSLIADLEKLGKWPIVNSRSMRDDGILFTTARKFKGLESAAIIVIDVDASSFDSPESRNLFYVGASRARSFLDIVAVLDSGQIQDLGEVLTDGQVVRNAMAKIASTLKVRIVRGE